MYRVELIPKVSTLNEVIDHWVKAGREYEFVFENAKSCLVEEGTIEIIDDCSVAYFYNMADFYRVKVIVL